MQIVDHLLRILDRRRLAATRKQLARTLHQLLLPAADHRRMNPKFHRQLRQGFSPESAAIATRALKAALCCFLFTPTSHASLDRSAFSLSHCPKNRSRRKNSAVTGRFEFLDLILRTDAEKVIRVGRNHGQTGKIHESERERPFILDLYAGLTLGTPSAST